MIYLDNAATTRLTEPVLSAMMPFLTSDYANPAVGYRFARRAGQAVEKARKQCAALLSASPEEIAFTGSGSEADNWALRSSLLLTGKRRVITTKIEHHAVLRCCEFLKSMGADVTYLDVDRYGMVSPEAVRQALTEDTALVSVMTASNEIGTVQPIGEIGAICRSRGVLFHTDAVQAYGHIPLNADEMCIDLLSASAHKLHGPKGAGLLYIRRGLKLPPLLFGASQENGLRAGTSNTAGIVGFGAAAEAAMLFMNDGPERISALRDAFIASVLEQIPGVRLNGHPTKRLPGIVSLTFSAISGAELMMLMDRAGICVSTGAACSAASMEPSHVLTSVGLSRAEANGTIRISLSDGPHGRSLTAPP